MLNYLQKNVDISELSNFRTPAKSKYFFELKTIDDVKKLKEIKDFADNNDASLLFIWWWTNLLFAFEEYEWIIIKNSLKWWEYNKSSHNLHIYSEERISDIASSLEKDFWQDLWHRFIGLPGSVWGAIFWNAWCFWLETSNNFVEANIYNLHTWQIEVFNKNQMQFWYRDSFVKHNISDYFIISASFDLSQKIEKYHSDVDNIYFREYKQPKWNTCWSFFKNPSKDNSAWFLIESVWLKGHKIWWAFFSDLHANFLMNDGTWTYKDLLSLISLAQEKVKKQHNIELIPEVRIITNKKTK